MEEKKTNETPVVQMNAKASTEDKPTYEELQREVFESNQRAKALYSKLQEINLFNLYKQLDYSFKVLELSDKFDSEFVERNKKEIMNIMSSVGVEPKNTTKEGE